MGEVENERAVIGGNQPPSQLEELTERFKASAAEVDRIRAAANATPKQVKSEDDLLKVGSVVTDARKMVKRLKADKTTEKQPFIDQGKVVEGFFGEMIEKLDRVAAVLEDRATDYQQAQAAAARRKAEEEAAKQRELAAAERKKAEELAAAGARGAAKALDKAERLEDKAHRSDRQADAKASDLTRVRSAAGVTATSKTSWAGEIVSMDEIDLEKLRPFLKREDVQKALNTFVRLGNRELKGARIFEDVRAAFRG